EVMVRPAAMFAPDDAFLTTILRLLRSLPAYPIFGDGRTRLQPVYVEDVATAIAQILRQSQKPYPIYELAGPQVYFYEELLRTVARIAGLRPVLMRMPFTFWNAMARVAEMLPPATHPQSGRTYADRRHGLRTPAGVSRAWNFAAIARRRTRSNTQAKQIKRFDIVTAPIVLPRPLRTALEAAAQALFDLGGQSSADSLRPVGQAALVRPV